MYQAEEVPETPIPPYEHHEPTQNEELQKVLAQEKGEHSKLLTKKTLTPSEVIDSLGFGWAQGINFLIISFGFVSLWSTVQLIPYLSTRLYVEFDLTPELESTLSVASFSGFAISHPLAGYVADRIGRKPAILLTSCWLAFWSFMCCSAQNITQLILYRCFFSLAGGNFALLLIYLYETSSPKHQWLGFLTTLCWGSAVGQCSEILLAIPFLSEDAEPEKWRQYVFIVTLPFVIFIPCAFFFLKESPRYLLSKGRVEEAKIVLVDFAQKNKVYLSPEINLVPEIEIGQSDDHYDLSIYEKLKIAVKNWDILRASISIIMIGAGCEFIFYAISIVNVELVFLTQQGDDSYCDGKHSDAYLLKPEDYVQLFSFQLCGEIIAALLIIANYKIKLNFKITVTGCYILSMIAFATLYSCPEIRKALSLVTSVYTLGVVFSIGMWLNLSGLLPTNIRSFMMGICTFIMYLPLPAAPYLIQTLSKKSEHYVTTVCLGFMGIGLIGAIILPTKIHVN
ncbi:putative transporter SVOPL isoform X2 [Convolutriloba macropyga]|uniref:putative transporter SVOPL isoform X2 n=1 Tax=Convolutriloba macropyga TaxID=536237 RepID=UPI003F527477